jgi:hypothetical protein
MQNRERILGLSRYEVLADVIAGPVGRQLLHIILLRTQPLDPPICRCQPLSAVALMLV